MDAPSKVLNSPEKSESDHSDAPSSSYTASLVQSAAKSILNTSTSVVSDDETSASSNGGRKADNHATLESLKVESVPAIPSKEDRKRFIGCLAAVLASSYDYDYSDENDNFETDDGNTSDFESYLGEEDDLHSCAESADISVEGRVPSLSKSKPLHCDQDSTKNENNTGFDETNDLTMERNEVDDSNEDLQTDFAIKSGESELTKEEHQEIEVGGSPQDQERSFAIKDNEASGRLRKSSSLSIFQSKRGLTTAKRSLQRHRKRRYQVMSSILLNASKFLYLDISQSKAFLPLLTQILNPPPRENLDRGENSFNDTYSLLGIDKNNFLWAFLESLTPGSGFRCMSMLLLEHLLRGEEGYDARVRRIYKKLAALILMHDNEYDERDDCNDLSDIEFATRKFEALEHEIAAQILDLSGGRKQKQKSLQKGTTEGGLTRQQVLRGLKIGSAGIVAGTIFAVTGGLAAPGIAAGVAALAGSSAAAAAVVTLTSTVAVTTIFGVGGAGLAAYKMHRRQRGLTEFEFERECGRGRGVREAELFTSICISGWIRDGCDFQRPWGVEPTNPPIRDLLELLERFYSVHKPENVVRCEEILTRWKGQEAKLFSIIRQKYGRSPNELFPIANGPREKGSLTLDQKELVELLFVELGYVSPAEPAKEEKSFGKTRTKWRDRFATSRRIGKESGTEKGVSIHGRDSSPRGDERSKIEENLRKENEDDKTLNLTDLPPHIKTVWDYQSTFGGELYTVRFESNLLLELGDSVEDLAVQTVANATQTVLLQSAIFATLLTAVAIPTALVKFANMIDGSWTLAIERSDEAGIELAKSLLFSQAGRRPVTLIGYSMGARIIYACLKELARYQEKWEEMREAKSVDSIKINSSVQKARGSKPHKDLESMREPASIIEDVILMGMPNHLSRKSWYLARQLVAGRLVNCYSKKDLILALMFRYKRLSGGFRQVCGTCAIDVPGVENYDVSDLISGHAQYCVEAGEVLRRLRHGQPIRASQNNGLNTSESKEIT